MNNLGGRAASVLIGLATAIVIVALTILPFLSPAWVAFEQGRAEATAWTGYTTEELRVATDAILADLVFGGDFAVEVNGQPVLNERERGHMADVRSVFRGLWVLAIISVVVLVAASRRARPRPDVAGRSRGSDRAVDRRGRSPASSGSSPSTSSSSCSTQIFFPAGSYLFDPLTDRLVQLFPFTFWFETAMVVGVVIIGVSLVVAFVAGRRAAAYRGP